MENFLRKSLGLILALMLALSATLFAQDTQDTVILATQSYWRAFYTLKTPVMKKGNALEKMKGEYNTPLPPTGWQNPDFDDGTWHRSPGGFFQAYRSRWAKIVGEELAGTAYNGSSPALALLCLRSKFNVSDPAKVKGLSLAATFRGGIIVYLNGKEVTRSHIASSNQRDMLAVADDYPVEAYLNEEGTPLAGTYWKKEDTVINRLRKRNRSIEKVPIPSSLLRKGINVLAIEVHRSAYSSDYIEKLWAKIKARKRGVDIWSTCDLIKVRFSALEAQGLEPNVSRPKGFQVWNSDLLYPDGVIDYGDLTEPLKPIAITGTRNGAFSGKVVLGCRDPIKGLQATICDLKQSKGGKIPASSVEIRYGVPTSPRKWAYPLIASQFEALLEEAPDEIPVSKLKPTPGAVMPIWLTVKVPANAKPGNYKGDLTVKAEGLEDIKVPVNIKVCPFKLPNPQDFHTFVELIPSPETVAMYYEVPLWSDKHFKLMENTFKLLGKIGNRTVYIPLIAKTNFGNSDTMVKWTKKKDGTYTYDFTIMNRYLDFVEEQMGKPRIVVLYVWDIFLKGKGTLGDIEGYKSNRTRPARDAVKGRGPQVSLLDPETGTVSYEELPQYTNKEASLKIWQPLIEELKKHLKKRGLEKRVMLGMVMDIEPAKEVISFFKELLPAAPWVRHSHGLGKNIHGQPYGYQAAVWHVSFLKWPELKSQMGWKRDGQIVQFRRGRLSPSLTSWMFGEMNITGKQRGFGRVPADFWPVLKDKKGKKTQSINGRYLQSNWGWLNLIGRGAICLLKPGPEGAAATVQFEMIREGVQECEAHIVVARALDEGKITGDLAERCQKLLDQRTYDMLLTLMSNHSTAGLSAKGFSISWGFRLGECWFQASDRQKRSQELFEIAAEVAKKVGVKN